MPLRPRLLATCCAAVFAFASAVHAEAADGEVEELIVTAQKREQRTIDVPIAVTAYGAQRLDELGLQEFEELSLFVPGFEVQNQSPNNPGFVMRGITSDSGEATNEPRVSVFQDGVSISKSRGSYIELFDLERVEVSKGPQSTLYGRGALIGAVNLVQAKADPSAIRAASKAEFGNYGYSMFEGMLNLPVGDTFAVRFAGRLKARDGFVENLLGGKDFNSTDTAAARLVFNWRPTERLNADLILNYEHDKPSGTSFKSITYAPTDPITGAVLGDTGRNSGAALSSAEGFMEGKDLGLDREVWGATALVDFEISDSLSLSSITAYREFDSLEIFDADGFSLPLFAFGEDAYGEQTSQELRLNYDNGGRVTAFAGVSYFHEDGFQRVPLQVNEKVYALLTSGRLPIPNGLSLPAINAVTPATLKSAHRENYTNYGETTAYDVFGDITFKLNDQLELTGGVRYSHEDKTSGYSANLENGPSGLTGRGVLAQPTLNGRIESQDLKDEGVTYRVVGRYAPSEALSLYASYARGRRPKVLTTSAPAVPFGPVRFAELPAEKVDSFELGGKGEFLARRLSLEGAAYRYEYENFQTTVLNAAGQLVSANAGEASAYGFETQVNARPSDNLEIFGTYAYSHARFGNGLFEGNSFRLSPDHSFSLGARLSADFAGGVVTLTPSYTWQSKIFFEANNDRPELQTNDRVQDEVQGSYGLLNLRVGFAPANAPWKVELFGTNLLEEEYIKDAGNTGGAFGIPTFIAGEPRYYGVSFSMRY